MISFDLLYLLMAYPCESAMVQRTRETVVIQCPAPIIKTPAVPPWWKPGITEEPTSVKIDPPKAKAVPKYKYPSKKKQKRKGKRK